jgi:ABC-type multidrug transport system fused ATPase/permease subunit
MLVVDMKGRQKLLSHQTQKLMTKVVNKGDRIISQKPIQSELSALNPLTFPVLVSLQHKQVSLWTCYVRSSWKLFLVSGAFKLLADLCGLVGPLSISYVVEFVNYQVSQRTASVSHGNSTRHATASDLTSHPSWSEFAANGWIMSGIVLVSFLLQGTFSQASTSFINMEGIKVKNALQGLIYRKTLKLSASCFHSKTPPKTADAAGDQKQGKDHDCDLNSPGTMTNLMSDDSLNVMTFFWISHYVWSIPLKVSKPA